MTTRLLQGASRRTRLFSLLVALLAALSVTAVASGKASAATGSYTITANTAPQLYNEDQFVDGYRISAAPSGVPSTATITSVSASFTWMPQTNPPGYYSANTNYAVFLCEDAKDTECANVSPTYNGQNSWTTITNNFNGLNASTLSYHVAAGLFDSAGTGGSIKKAINPNAYVTSQSVTVNYTY